MTDAAGQRTFSYTGNMQLDAETLPSSFYGYKVLTNNYESSSVTGRDKGFKLGTSTDLDADMEIMYGYSTKGRLNAVTDSKVTYNYSYVTDSDMIGTTSYPNGLTSTRAYETTRNLVDSVDNTVSGTTVSKYDYTNDAVGRRTDVVTTGTAFTADTFNNYTYNTRSEVTGAQKYNGTDTSDTSDPVTSYDYDLIYDNIGNREESSTGILPVTTYTTNDLNQYTAISDLTDPVHDEDGNMTLMPSSSGDWNMTWNAENRLVKAENDSTKLEFTYDYMGRRVQKQVYAWDAASDLWSLTSDLRYVYDGWNLIQTLDAQNSNAVVKDFTWGLDLSQSLQGAGGVGGLLAVIEHGETADTPYYTTYDANGNISEYLDNTGSVVAHYEYSPFGRLTLVDSETGAPDFNHRFSTKYLDSETNLYYYGYRYYSNELGRWLSTDPIEEGGGLNLLSCNNSLLNQIDAYGFFVLPVILEPAPLTMTRTNAPPSGYSGYKFSNREREFEAEKKCCKNGAIKKLNRIKVVQRVEGAPGFGGKRFTGVDGLIGDLEAQTGPCTCIKKLVISNHSGEEGLIPLEELDPYNPPECFQKRTGDVDSSDFARIKKTLCDGATIEIRMCRALGGKDGARQGQWLANQTGANIEGYAGPVSPYGTVVPYNFDAKKRENERFWFPRRQKRSFKPE